MTLLKLYKLIVKHGEELNVKLVAGNLTDNGNYHAIFKRNFDNTHVVWTANDSYTGFYNGKYDMSLEQAHKELSRRSTK